jgi:hypothetical protein
VFPLRSLACDGQGLLAGSSRRETRLRSSLRSSNHNPLGNCVGAQVETSCGPNSARARFLIAARRTTPVRVWTGTVTKPSRGAGDICLSHRAKARVEGLSAPAAVNLSPVARDYPSRARGGFFRPLRCDCSIKERGQVAERLMQIKDFLPHNLLTAPAAVNNLRTILYAGYSPP